MNLLLERFLDHSLINHVTKKCFSLDSVKNGVELLLRHIRSSSTRGSCGVNDAEGTESIEIDATPMLID